MSNKHLGVVEVYEDRGGEHRFRCRAANGEILFDGYASPSAAKEGWHALRAFCYQNPPVKVVGKDTAASVKKAEKAHDKAKADADEPHETAQE